MTPLNEITHALKCTQIADPAYKAFREKTSKLIVLGHRLPVLQTLARTGFSFYTKSPKNVLRSWNAIWKTSQTHEALTLPLVYYRHHLDQLGLSHWYVMKQWIHRIENWEHADSLCALYSVIFERFSTQIEPTLRTWNQSKNPWKQRASIVSLIYYTSPKRKAPSVKLVLELVEPLIQSRDTYVAKAVGWTLRESYKLYPKETLAFLTQHIHQLAPASFSYATEKLSKIQKNLLKSRRKKP